MSCPLRFVPDWFVTHQQIKIRHDNDKYCNDDELIKCYKRYQKRKAQKASIKEELMPIAWHHKVGGIDVFPKTKKRRQKNCEDKQGLFLFDDQIQKNLART